MTARTRSGKDPLGRHEPSSTVNSAFSYEPIPPPTQVELGGQRDGWHLVLEDEQEEQDEQDGTSDEQSDHTDGQREKTKQTRKRKKTFKLLTDLEVENLPSSVGVLGDILYEDATVFLYGRSEHWKTFIALSWALCIASEIEWLGRKVNKRGPVVYVTAEGAHGIGKRIHAWKAQHKKVGESVPIRVLADAVHLLNPEHITALRDAIRKALRADKPAMIVIDTLAYAMAGGNENSAEDIGKLISNANYLRRIFGCCVLFVHHIGYDTTHMRGSTAIFGAGDTVIRVRAADENKSELEIGDALWIECEKQRDEERFKRFSVTTRVVGWHDEERKRDVSSLVIVASETSAQNGVSGRGRPKLSAADAKLYKLFLTLVASDSEGVQASVWEERAEARLNMPRRSFYRGVDRLCEDGYVWKDTTMHRYREPRFKPEMVVELDDFCQRTTDGKEEEAR